jgi:hypothetical protein
LSGILLSSLLHPRPNPPPSKGEEFADVPSIPAPIDGGVEWGRTRRP